MGLRLRKSINLGGGFRINLSKSGVGYSWGTKGYRITKTATGKTRKTYSIPGTGISYVDEKGKSSYTHSSDSNNFEYSNETEYNKKETPTMKNILKIILGILLFLILFTYFTPGLILGAIAIIIYYIVHRKDFMEKSFLKKLGICVLIFFLMISGTACGSGESSDVSQDQETVPENLTDEDTADETPIEEIQLGEITEPEAEQVPQDEEAAPEEQNMVPAAEVPAEAQTQAETDPPEIQAPTSEEIVVYITNTGAKYHEVGCRFLDESQYETTLQNAISQGYEACKVCKPPTQ